MPKQIFPQGDNRWLNDDAVIWRYVPLRTLFFYLNGLVFIPSVAKLRAVDPFEGEFYEDIAWFNSAFADQYGNDAGAVDEWMRKELCSDSDRRHIDINKTYPNAAAEVFRRRYFEFIRRTRYAWCWFQSYRESAAMWSVYGNQGVAIQSSVGRLRAAFQKTDLEFACGRMTYVDYRSGVSGEFDPLRQSDYRLLLRPFFLKRKEFESEQEVRFVTDGSDLDERGGILLKALAQKIGFLLSGFGLDSPFMRRPLSRKQLSKSFPRLTVRNLIYSRGRIAVYLNSLSRLTLDLSRLGQMEAMGFLRH